MDSASTNEDWHCKWCGQIHEPTGDDLCEAAKEEIARVDRFMDFIFDSLPQAG